MFEGILLSYVLVLNFPSSNGPLQVMLFCQCECVEFVEYYILTIFFFPKDDSLAQSLKFSSFVGCCLFMQKVRDGHLL